MRRRRPRVVAVVADGRAAAGRAAGDQARRALEADVPVQRRAPQAALAAAASIAGVGALGAGLVAGLVAGPAVAREAGLVVGAAARASDAGYSFACRALF